MKCILYKEKLFLLVRLLMSQIRVANISISWNILTFPNSLKYIWRFDSMQTFLFSHFTSNNHHKWQKLGLFVCSFFCFLFFFKKTNLGFCAENESETFIRHKLKPLYSLIDCPSPIKIFSCVLSGDTDFVCVWKYFNAIRIYFKLHFDPIRPLQRTVEDWLKYLCCATASTTEKCFEKKVIERFTN